VLVPAGGAIDPACEQGLQELERRGYQVRRLSGFSAIDFGRCVIASDALRAGFEDFMWIDSDVVFHPDDVERLRSHSLPLVCGIYSKKRCPEFACDFLPGTKSITFGKNGGLVQIRYVGFGFMLTKREIYPTMQAHLELPVCNQRFGSTIVPWFMPMVVPDGHGLWYLSEDYAFCERARKCGISIMADTRIRLYHVGSHGYSWEDPGHQITRYESYIHHFPIPAALENPTPVQSPLTDLVFVKKGSPPLL